MPPALELGLGAQEVLSVPGKGRVVGVYSKAVYLRLPAGLVALTSFDVPSGPIHARTTASLNGLKVGDKVVLTASLLQAGPVLLGLQNAEIWQGVNPTSHELDRSIAPAIRLLKTAPASGLDSRIVDSARILLVQNDLAGTASLLGGRGPGLTPAGDDCLAGILLIAAIASDGSAPSRLQEVAESVSTNGVSRAFLRWSALGQSIEPVHRFLLLASKGAARASEALREVTSFGHTSGADLLIGVRLALDIRQRTAVSRQST